MSFSATDSARVCAKPSRGIHPDERLKYSDEDRVEFTDIHRRRPTVRLQMFGVLRQCVNTLLDIIALYPSRIVAISRTPPQFLPAKIIASVPGGAVSGFLTRPSSRQPMRQIIMKLRADRARSSGQTPDILRGIHRHERPNNAIPLARPVRSSTAGPICLLTVRADSASVAQLRAGGRTGSGFLRERCTRSTSRESGEPRARARRHAPGPFGPVYSGGRMSRQKRFAKSLGPRPPVRVDPPSSRWAGLHHPRMGRTPSRITVLGGC
jgi:hypothetical protein